MTSAQLDDWIKIEPDNTITAYSGKVELGTGVRTALAQIVAEELDMPLDRVHMVMGDTALTPDEGYTAGSMTIVNSGSSLRQASAEARRVLLELASEQLDAMTHELVTHDGIVTVSHDPERSIQYSTLMGGKAFNREITGDAPLKRPEDYSIVGTPAPRTDLPKKIVGQPSFVQDVRLPGMLHARMVRPPARNATLLSVDEASIAHIPGIVKIVREGNFLGVVAEREEQAVKAAKQLKVQWQGSAELPSMTDLYTTLRTQQSKDDVIVDTGNLENGLSESVQQLSAVYYQPYHAHASIGPSCAVADFQPDQITVWSSTQGPYPLRGALAQLLDVPLERIHLMHTEGAGCYGQNGSDDATADAVILSRAVGKPVRAQWSREDEFVWEPKSAAMVIEVQAGLDAVGKVAAWNYQVWTSTHAARPRLGTQLIAYQLVNMQPPPPYSRFSGGDRNAPNNYTFANQRVTMHWLANTPLRVSSYRGLGATGNAFANEAFMDELAVAAGIDPLEFRLRHLQDPRAREALTAAAEAAGWLTRPPSSAPEGWAEGWGLAFTQYENTQAYAAAVAQVHVNVSTGEVRVLRIVVSHDCGLIINPDGLKNQIEGNVIQSLSRALKEEVQFNEMRVTSVDWQTYPILTFPEIPEIEVVLINRPHEPAIGAGEPATVITAPAVANAIFNATSIRLRQVPFTPERIKAAVQT